MKALKEIEVQWTDMTNIYFREKFENFDEEIFGVVKMWGFCGINFY